MKIKLKDLPNVIFEKIDAKSAKNFMNKYFELHKDVDPDMILEFNIPLCFKTEEEKKESISKFYAISANGGRLDRLDKFAETDLVGIAKSYNSKMTAVERYIVPQPGFSVGIMGDSLSFATGDRSVLFVGTDYEHDGDEYYHGINKLVFGIKETKKKQRAIVLNKCVLYKFPMDKIDDIHKILTVYDYASKQAEKLTVRLTKDNIYPFIVKAVEDFLEGEEDSYGFRTFSNEKFEFVNKLIDSLDIEIVHKAYVSAEKTAQQINEAQTTATTQTND